MLFCSEVEPAACRVPSLHVCASSLGRLPVKKVEKQRVDTPASRAQAGAPAGAPAGGAFQLVVPHFLVPAMSTFVKVAAAAACYSTGTIQCHCDDNMKQALAVHDVEKQAAAQCEVLKHALPQVAELMATCLQPQEHAALTGKVQYTLRIHDWFVANILACPAAAGFQCQPRKCHCAAELPTSCITVTHSASTSLLPRSRCKLVNNEHVQHGMPVYAFFLM